MILCWGGFIALLSPTTSPGRRPPMVFWSMAGSGCAKAGIRPHSPWLERGLWACCLLTLVVLVLERGRSRRQEDALHANLFILLLILARQPAVLLPGVIV